MSSHEIDDKELKPVELPLLLKKQARILFGMTGRQVLITTCGISVGFSLWQSFALFQSLFGAFLLIGFCVVPALLIAFVTINGRPLEEWLIVLFAWLLTPEHLSLQQLVRFFVKVKVIEDDLVALDIGGGSLTYQAIVRIEAKSFDLLSGAEQAIAIEAFERMLNGLSYPVTIHIRMLPYFPSLPTSVPGYLAKALRRFHAEYLAFLSQLVRAKLPVRVSYYLVIQAENQRAEKDEMQRFEHAKGQIAHRLSEVDRQLARAGLATRRLKSLELFTFYQESFFTQEAVTGETRTGDVSLATQLSPRSLSIAASWLSVEASGQTYQACLALTHLPRVTYPGWIHHLIEMNEPYIDICLHIQPQSSDIVTKHLQQKAVELGGALRVAAQQGELRGNTVTRHALKDIERVRDRLIRQEGHIYSMTLLLLVRASSRAELSARVERVRLALRSLDFQASPLRFQHHLGYYSCLGYGSTQNMLSRYSHLLPTDAVASFYPFFNVPTMEDTGVLLGVTDRGNLISFNPYGEGMLNANLAVLGVPGSGKSFFLKVILSRLAPGARISLIDVEGEYALFIQAIGGRRVDLSADSLQINPLELLGDTSLPQKIATLVGFFALLLGDGGTLTQSESALIRECLIKVYAASGITSDPATHRKPAPGVTDFCMVLKKGEQGGDLSRRLAAYQHLFPRHTQVKFDSQHTLYNLQQLPEALRPAATYLITERLWSTLQEGREREMTRHLVVIDEAWFLSKFEYGAVLLNEFARRIRKYGGGLWAGTQQIGDLLSSEQGKNLLALCETKMLFKQDVSSIDAVQTVLHLSAAQMKFLRTARSGEALYITSKDSFAVEILASEQEAAMARTTGERLG
jgi:hypothetical protein